MQVRRRFDCRSSGPRFLGVCSAVAGNLEVKSCNQHSYRSRGFMLNVDRMLPDRLYFSLVFAHRKTTARNLILHSSFLPLTLMLLCEAPRVVQLTSFSIVS